MNYLQRKYAAQYREVNIMAVAKPKAKKVKVEQICTTCEKQLPLTMFYKDGTNKAGIKYRKECKQCYNDRRKERDLAKTLPDAMTLVTVKHIESDKPNEG
jgi:hypothetical protein